MIKTQIQLKPSQHRRLQELARRRRVSMAEAIRQSVDAVLSHPDRYAAWDRAAYERGQTPGQPDGLDKLRIHAEPSNHRGIRIRSPFSRAGIRAARLSRSG